MYANIEPVVYRTGQAACLVIRNVIVQIGNRAIVEWALMGDPLTDKRDYESGGTLMEGVDYAAWGSEDDYVYDWLGSKLNEVVITSIDPRNYWEVTPSPAP